MPIAKGAGLLGPIAAAGAASLFNSQEAEAGVGGIMRNIPDAVAAINKAVQGGAGQRNQIGVLENIMHDKNFSNYHEMNNYARKVDGNTAGDYWKGEVQSMADQLREAGGLTDEADKHLQAWLDDHLSRELGWKAQKATTRAPVKPPEPNLAFGDLKKMMAGGGAAGAAGSTTAGESPTLGWGEWPTQEQPVPTSPQERGFAPWSDYEPEPSYLDRVTDPATYANALRPYAQGLYNLSQSPVGQFIGGQVSDLMEDYDSAGQYARGAGRGLYGLLSGESPSQAWDAGVGVSDQSAEESGQAVQQWAADRGWHPDDASAAGMATEWLTNPLDYMGLGLFGKATKVAR